MTPISGERVCDVALVRLVISCSAPILRSGASSASRISATDSRTFPHSRWLRGVPILRFVSARWLSRRFASSASSR